MHLHVCVLAQNGVDLWSTLLLCPNERVLQTLCKLQKRQACGTRVAFCLCTHSLLTVYFVLKLVPGSHPSLCSVQRVAEAVAPTNHVGGTRWAPF
jgi:hypothetical protein